MCKIISTSSLSPEAGEASHLRVDGIAFDPEDAAQAQAENRAFFAALRSEREALLLTPPPRPRRRGRRRT